MYPYRFARIALAVALTSPLMGSVAPAQAEMRGKVAVSQISASERPTTRGTRVTVGYTLTNHATRTKPSRYVRLALVDGDGDARTFGLARTARLAPGEVRTIESDRLVGPHVVEGTYATRVCFTRHPQARCATSATPRASVTIAPATLTPSRSTVVVPSRSSTSATPRLAPAEGSSRVRVTNTGQARTGRLQLALLAHDPYAAPGANSTPSTAFTLTATTCASSLSAGQHCTVDVARTGESPDASSAELTVSGARGAAATVALVGPVRILPSPFDFGPVAVGDSLMTSFDVVNNTDADIQVLGGNLSDQNDFSFDFNGPFTCLTPLVPAGASCTVSVRYLPSGVGEHAAVGTLFTSEGEAQFFVSGTGLEGVGSGAVNRALRSSWTATR